MECLPCFLSPDTIRISAFGTEGLRGGGRGVLLFFVQLVYIAAPLNLGRGWRVFGVRKTEVLS